MNQKESSQSGSGNLPQSLRGWGRAGVALFRLFASLKLAVVVMSALTLSMIAATLIESIADTPTAQYFVYRSWWFKGSLLLLGVNILVVALSRLPWKKHHSAFLLAHAGILLLLAGSAVTDRFGIDGMMRIQEGQTASVIEIQDPHLFFTENGAVESVPLPWQPPGTTFRPRDFPKYQVTVERFISRAEPRFEFLKAERGTLGYPAARLRIQGGPMRITQEYWLFGGDASWRSIQAGPAWLTLDPDLKLPVPATGPVFGVFADGKGGWAFRARNSAGEVRSGPVEIGKPIEPGWRGGVTITLLEAIPQATNRVEYAPSKVEFGPQAPPSAIRLKAGKSREAAIWLGLGDRASLEVEGRKIDIAYLPRRLMLPYSIHLDRFAIEYYNGTRDPMSYSSQVTVLDPANPDEAKKSFAATVSMNEPLHHRDLTFYQSSYEPGEPRPTISLFSVNRDPGRSMKYAGSLLLTLGTILLFMSKLKKSARTKSAVSPAEARVEAPEVSA